MYTFRRISIKDRRLSWEDDKLYHQMSMLQTSNLVQQVNLKLFSQSKWRELFAIIHHKALILRCIARILNLCLPYKIDRLGYLTEGENKYTLIPSKLNSNHDKNMQAYKMLKWDMEFLYKNIKQMSRIQNYPFYVDFVTKLWI